MRWSPWGLKKKVLRRFTTTARQYGPEFRHALQDLIRPRPVGEKNG
jgi:hypothetical protein